MPTKVKTRIVPSWQVAQKVGTPDFAPEVVRAKTIYGYNFEPDESFFMAIIIASDLATGAYPFTVLSIASGAVVDLIDTETGALGITPPAGYDFLIKEFWCNFDQPVRFTMEQMQIPDISCDVRRPAFSVPEAIAFPIGWTRNQIESILVASLTRIRIQNLGAEAARGKCWIVGFMRPRVYPWY